MGLFSKDRNLALSPDHVELDVRASDFGLKRGELELRLDAFLCRHLTWRSRTSVQRLIRDGYVLVGATPPERAVSPRVGAQRPVPEARLEKRPARVLHDGARVVVVIPPELRLPEPSLETAGLDVLYEDDEILAVNKPPMLAVHPSGRHLSDTLIQRVHARYRMDGNQSPPLRLCHRLDRETSGIVLIGKGERAHREVALQFENREVEKEYLALVHGAPTSDAGTIDAAIGPAHTSDVRLKMTVRVDGLSSRTDWSVRERCGPFTLLACLPRTGRQHQIRVHLESIGLPLVGDKLYGVDEDVFLRGIRGDLTDRDRSLLGMERHALHHSRVVWRSPRTASTHEVVSELPADMSAFLRDAR